jgi:predicted enzyme related to lactoylglutathione lyase
MPEGTYSLIKPGEGTGGGMMKNPIPNAPSSWVPYVEVADVDAAATKAKSLGAKVCKDKTEVMGRGWFVIVQDPTGELLGLWQSKKA